jgi:hypothetical protein
MRVHGQAGLGLLTAACVATLLAGFTWANTPAADDAKDDPPGQDVKPPAATLSNWKIARTFELDGETDHVRVEDHRDLRVETLTISAWINTADAELLQPVVTKAQDTGNWNSYILRIQDGGRVLICVEGRKSENHAVHFMTKGRVIKSKRWHHVAATWASGKGDASDAKVYIDGVEQEVEITHNANYGPGFKIFYTGGPLYIGRDEHPTGHFKGTIKDVQIIGRVLTAAEVKAIAGKGAAK